MLQIVSVYSFPCSLRHGRHAVAPFLDTVLHVVGMSAKPEMTREDTWRDIATMQDKKPILGPMPCCDEKADYVRTNVSWLMWCGAKIAIAVGVGGSYPEPALTLRTMPRRFIDLAPKPISKRDLGLSGIPVSMVALLTTKARRLCFPRSEVENDSTQGESAWNKQACHQRTSTAVKGYALGQ
jgi:hypothetical protein